ncbi:type IV pilin protein [Pseudomonas sp. 10B1]|uniref:type IV pilin protein n=1 Tax=unclassified Pseudomonas TaxID=196821 RepID=UPI002AB588EF|nr:MULTISPECIES: type IV pilin protein [unclassified Pseudomonas]MDY7561912.1 type IV pilin protein [Pseudomonas sp. AB6]MEA9976060.1 type IV pilin protein [Pseudomonas sp. RTS4]MEA9993434.1 type IV pilin protein [Pseudomonas sp. AA4]MEB0088954.1 type IV pilin protein [Pseudomonas sp. RTI1]MEB0126293.1 type IV pilin protein [Pseudomonas sp. CCC1.2]
MHKRIKGFTLIELMIVVAIIGILAAVAYPSYTEYVKRTHRSEIAALVSATAQSMERFYTRNGQYSDVVGPPAVALTLPAGNGYYTLAATVRTAAAFTLTATPIAGTMMAGDKCGNFVIDNTGLRSNTAVTGGATSQICWGR